MHLKENELKKQIVVLHIKYANYLNKNIKWYHSNVLVALDSTSQFFSILSLFQTNPLWTLWEFVGRSKVLGPKSGPQTPKTKIFKKWKKHPQVFTQVYKIGIQPKDKCTNLVFTQRQVYRISAKSNHFWSLSPNVSRKDRQTDIVRF